MLKNPFQSSDGNVTHFQVAVTLGRWRIYSPPGCSNSTLGRWRINSPSPGRGNSPLGKWRIHSPQGRWRGCGPWLTVVLRWRCWYRWTLVALCRSPGGEAWEAWTPCQKSPPNWAQSSSCGRATCRTTGGKGLTNCVGWRQVLLLLLPWRKVETPSPLPCSRCSP